MEIMVSFSNIKKLSSIIKKTNSYITYRNISDEYEMSDDNFKISRLIDDNHFEFLEENKQDDITITYISVINFEKSEKTNSKLIINRDGKIESHLFDEKISDFFKDNSKRIRNSKYFSCANITKLIRYVNLATGAKKYNWILHRYDMKNIYNDNKHSILFTLTKDKFEYNEMNDTDNKRNTSYNCIINFHRDDDIKDMISGKVKYIDKENEIDKKFIFSNRFEDIETKDRRAKIRRYKKKNGYY